VGYKIKVQPEREENESVHGFVRLVKNLKMIRVGA